MQTAKVDNWQVVMRESPVDSHQYFILTGVVTGHPMIPDGHEIRTTAIQEIDLKKGTAQTKNTIYELGSPSPAMDGPTV